MTTPDNLLDLNTATLVELRNLPGIGPALAERILTARPFASPAGLLHLRGFSPALLAQLQGYITVVPVEPVAAGVEAGADGSEPLSGPVRSASGPGPGVFEPALFPPPVELHLEPAMLPREAENPAPLEPPGLSPETQNAPDAPPSQLELLTYPPEPRPTGPSPRPPQYVTRPQALFWVVVSAFVSSALSISLVLILLLVFNGGLRFARQSQVTQLNRQVTALNSQAGNLNTRLEALESLDERVILLESGADETQTELALLQTGYAQMAQDVEEMELQVDALITRSNRFEAFLDGLRLLLSTLAMPEVHNP